MLSNRKKLENRVAFFAAQGFDLSVGYAYGQPRISSKDESRDISPRATAKELLTWLDGFNAALEEIERNKNILKRLD